MQKILDKKVKYLPYLHFYVFYFIFFIFFANFNLISTPFKQISVSCMRDLLVHNWSAYFSVVHFQAQDMRCLLQYMYLGESQVQSQQLESFLQLGEELAILGLITRGEEKIRKDLGNKGDKIKSEQENRVLTPESVQPGENSKTALKLPKQEQMAPTYVKELETLPRNLQNIPITADAIVPLSFTDLISPLSRKYHCDKCNLLLPNKATLKRHPCNKNEQFFKCDLCPFTFQLDILLKQHIEAKHTGRPEPPQPKRRNRRSPLEGTAALVDQRVGNNPPQTLQ